MPNPGIIETALGQSYGEEEEEEKKIIKEEEEKESEYETEGSAQVEEKGRRRRRRNSVEGREVEEGLEEGRKRSKGRRVGVSKGERVRG